MTATSWTGVIAFGATRIPIRMYKATKSVTRPSFHRIHAKDNGRMKRLEICSECGEKVQNGEVIRGYDLGGEMIPFTVEEVDNLRPEKGDTMMIDHFAKKDEIPTIAIEDSYYVGTEKEKVGGYVAFATFRDAMIKADKVAIVKWTTRGYDNLGILEPYANGFVVSAIRFAQEIRSPDEIEIMKAEPNKKLVKSIVSIIDSMTKKFDHDSIRDKSTDTIVGYVEKRVSGEIEAGEIIIAPTEDVDFEASIEAMAKTVVKAK